MAPFCTTQPSGRDWVQPSRFVPLNMDTRFGSPYGLPGGGPTGVCTVSVGLFGDTLPAASRAVTVTAWSASGVRPVQVPVVVVPETEPHARPSAARSYPTTPTSSVDAAHVTVTLFGVMLTWLGLPGAVGGVGSPMMP
jgi:hypothetical protein